MKIAQIAPLAESVPPRLYGGTERVVSYLTEELVRLGHDVTLFASADSQTGARLVACALVNATFLPSGETATWSAAASPVASCTGVPHACVAGSTGTRHTAGRPDARPSRNTASPALFQTARRSTWSNASGSCLLPVTGRSVKRIAYKFRWIDREGMRAWEEEPWKPVMLYENSNLVINTIAPTNKAADFRLILRSEE